MLKFNDTLARTSATLFLYTFVLLYCVSNSSATEHQRESAVVKAVRKVRPVVVNISSEYEVRKRFSPFSGFSMDPAFESFFQDFFDPGFEQRYKRTSLGSGVIIDGKRGFILTNEHVIKKTATINIILQDGREFEAQIVGTDPDSDLAVLRITSKEPLPDIEMGNSDDLMIGETVFAIGNPFGFSNTVTTGVISAINRSIRTEEAVYHDFIQTDASINPGNSGGPLLNINGELIGINTAVYAKAQGIGFAIPINKAKRIVYDLIKYGEVTPAWIGITIQDIDAELAQYLKLADLKGVLITKVEKTGPAHTAGFRDGDIIRSIGSRDIRSETDYWKVMGDFSSGQTIQIKIMREGKARTLSVTASIFPRKLALELANTLFGVTVENLSKEKRYQHNIDTEEGVLISAIDRQSYLAHIGVRPGDVIRQMNDIIIKRIEDFEKAVIKYRQKNSVVILVQRGDQLYNITVKL
jgi:Do/DeqQ family serine protease